jgi:two-component system response regulator HydG
MGLEVLTTTVLVVDDDPKMRELLTSILENAGYIVEAAGDGKEAVKACKKFPIDVALIDVELPHMKGTKLLGTLKELHPKMVKIIITGYPSIEDAVTAVNEKADGYILKPFNPADLLEVIKKLITEKKNEYLTMLREVEEAKQNTPQFKYQNPDRW